MIEDRNKQPRIHNNKALCNNMKKINENNQIYNNTTLVKETYHFKFKEYAPSVL